MFSLHVSLLFQTVLEVIFRAQYYDFRGSGQSDSVFLDPSFHLMNTLQGEIDRSQATGSLYFTVVRAGLFLRWKP